jgi:3-oxoacyl-[acyl-carrier-protein] synthase II
VAGKRIVVTGLGVISPIGIGHRKFFENLVSGKSGVARISHFDPSDYSSKIAAEVKDFNPAEFLDKKEARRLVRFIQFSVAASMLAAKDANLENFQDPNRVGVIIGSGIGGIDFLEEQVRVLVEKGPAKLSPFTVPYMITNMAAGYVSIMLKVKGPNSCIVTACATGTHSIGEAFRLLQRGDADVMLAGGAEASISPLGVGTFCAARALSTGFNDTPEKASRPFDAKRDGFVMGEGAATLVLETEEHAKARGAQIYGEVVGYGMSGDAHHITAPAPEGEGAARAINAALKDAGIESGKIDYINAHGTSTALNDKFETMAIKKVFGDNAYKISISSNKSMVGHLLGAAGAVEFAATLLSIKNNIVPPTINLENPDPDCDLDYTPGKANERTINCAISNSFGFGGHNAVLVAKKYTP